MITKEEIQKLLKEALKPLERKVEKMTNEFVELKQSVEFLNEKYEHVLSQLQTTNEKVENQTMRLNQTQSELGDVRKESRDTAMDLENLAQYLRRDCLEISGIPLSEDYTCNDIVMSVGQAIEVPITEEEISTAHPLPSYNSEAPPKVIVKFTRRDTRNAFYTNRRKLINKKTDELPDLGLTAKENVYISESLTPYKKKLFGEINKMKKRLKWKHIWTQNGRIYIKEAEKTRPAAFDSYEELAEFQHSLQR